MTILRTAAVALALLFSVTSPARSQSDPIYMLDFVFLNDGQTLADRTAYNAKAAPIAARYGINLIATLDPLAITDGPQTLARVDLWTLPAPQALQAWGNDPDYVALRPDVDRIHNTHDLTLYLAEKISAPNVMPGTAYHLELLTFREESWDKQAFIAYMQEVDRIAATHGIARQASLSGLVRLTGSGPTANWFNLYSVPGPDEYTAMATDPAYRALDPQRLALFVSESRVMGAFLAQ